jgi:MFS family permease
MSSGLFVALAAFFVVLCMGGARLSFGVWIAPLEEDFGIDRSAVSLVAALGYLAFGIVQPVLGRIVDLHGSRIVLPVSVVLGGAGMLGASLAPGYLSFLLVYVLVGSIGFGGIANATLAATVSQRFTSRHGLIFGFISAGAPFGQLVVAPLVAVAVAAIGWRPTMSWIGIVLLAVILPVTWFALARNAPPPARATAGESAGGLYRMALANRGFQLLMLSYFICGVTTLGLIHTHVVPYGIEVGLPDFNAARVLGLIGLCNSIGLVLWGQAADRWGGRNPLIFVFAVRSVALLWLATATEEATLVAFAIVFGLTDMATIPLSATAAIRLFDRRVTGVVVGLLAIAHQVGSATGSYLAGVGHDVFGTYAPAIVVAAGVALCGSLAMSAVDMRRHRQRLDPAAAPA